MFVIKDTLVSLDLIEKFFVCDLQTCKGICCIEGDAGAPLLKSEDRLLKHHLPDIKKFLTPEGKTAIEKHGTSYIDNDGDTVTTLVNGCECAFSIKNEDGICLCALEKAYREKKLPNLKPSSCHLYPVRLTPLNNMTALNLHRWEVCGSAELNGKKKGIRAYQFLKEPLIRQFGTEWYKELEETAKEWLKRK